MSKDLDSGPEVTLDDVVRVIARDFPNDEQAAAALLDDSRPERIQLAILKLSRGRIDELRRYIKVAKEDFRDVICPAEYPRFWAIGMHEASQLSPGQREQLQRDDLNEYQSWLTASVKTA